MKIEMNPRNLFELLKTGLENGRILQCIAMLDNILENLPEEKPVEKALEPDEEHHE